MNNLLQQLNTPLAKILLVILALYGLTKLYRLWLNWHKRRWLDMVLDATREIEIPDDMPPLSTGDTFIENTLKEWQCDYKIDSDKEDVRTWFHFTFHGTDFCIIFNKKTGNSHIVTQFATYPANDYPIVRAICNRLNNVSIAWTASYTLDGGPWKYAIYLSAPLICPAQSEVVFRRVLNYTMTDFTAAAESLKATEEQIRSHPLSNCEADLEHAATTLERDMVLSMLAEFEIFKQETTLKELPNKYSFTLRDLLNTLNIPYFDLNCSLRKAGEEASVLTNDDALNTQLCTFLIDSSGTNAFFCKEAALICEINLAEDDTPKLRLSLTLTAERATENTLYYRLNVLYLNGPVSTDAPFCKKRTTPRAYSWLLAYDKKDENALRAKARYFIEEAEEKIKTGKEATLTDDEQILMLASSAANKHCLFNAISLFRSMRYAEAAVYFENALQSLKEEGEAREPTKSEKAAVSRLLYYIGFCYNMLKQYKQAFFYLDAIFHLNQVEVSKQYILCLVGEKDPRAAFAVDHCMEQVQAYEHALEGEEMNTEVYHFKTFLLRQKIILLVNDQQFDEAKKYLNTLLQLDPDSPMTKQELEWFEQMQADNAKPSPQKSTQEDSTFDGK